MKKYALKFPPSNIPETMGHRDLWNSLSGKKICNQIVIIENMTDFQSAKCGPKFLAREIYVSNCNKNFVYYYIGKYTFPLLETLNLLSHPCEPGILHINVKRINLGDSYRTYKRRWASDNDRVVVVSTDELFNKMKEYQSEDIIIED